MEWHDAEGGEAVSAGSWQEGTATDETLTTVIETETTEVGEAQADEGACSPKRPSTSRRPRWRPTKADAGPIRTCVGCRRRRSPEALVRVVADGAGGVAIGRTLAREGRVALRR